jgi:hypothetical protein
MSTLRFMTTIDLEREIPLYRSALHGNLEALEALDLLEDYDFDAEEALYAAWDEYEGGGQQERGPNTDRVKDALSRVRQIICQDAHSQELAAATIATTLDSVIQLTGFPPSLATILLMYVLKVGIEEFCEL